MSMQGDVLSTYLASSGSVSTNRNRLKSVSYRGNGTLGSLVFKDGGASGTALLELSVGTGDTVTNYVILPGEGVLFGSNIYAVLTNVSAATVFYG